MANETAMVVQTTSTARAFEPGSFGEAMTVAATLVESRMFPHVKSKEAAFAIIATGRELGLSMMQSLRGVHLIEGKPTLSSSAMVAICKARKDVCTYFRLVESTDLVATYETLRVGEPEPTRMSFSWEDAKRAGVTGKDNWRKFPAAMLRARCETALARAVYPDLLMGVYEPEELERAPVRGTYAVVSEMPTETPPPPASEPRVVDLAPYEQAVELATTVDDLVKVWGVAKSDGLGEDQLARVKGLCSAKRAVLEGRAA
jgi:hypothetical protein